MNKVDKNGIESRAPIIARKACGRCGIAIEENAFCRACRGFFRGLGSQKAVSTTALRKTQTHWSGVSSK